MLYIIVKCMLGTAEGTLGQTDPQTLISSSKLEIGIIHQLFTLNP